MNEEVNKEKPHYGYYALKIFVLMIGCIVAGGVVVYVFLSPVAGIILGAFGGYLLVSYISSLYLLNQYQPLDFTDVFNLQGNEKVLDVGCGLGKVTIGVAKQLTTGNVIGIDIWDATEIPGNSPETAYKNAELEGVRDNVTFETGNVLDIPFEDNSFDLVTSSSVLNNLHGDEQKLEAMKEVYRVLKRGGTFFLLEPLRDLRGFFIFTPLAFWMLLPKNKWIALLEKADFVNLKYTYKGAGYFIVEKP